MSDNEVPQSRVQNDIDINPFRESSDFAELRKELVSLDADDARVGKKTGEYRAGIEKKLGEIASEISILEKKYAGDPEFEAIKQMHTDLECDFLNQKDLDIDVASFISLLEEAKRRISSAGIEVKNLDETRGETSQMVERMKELGMQVEYVATYPDAKNFHILILQAHPNPGMSEGMQKAGGVPQSQKAIEKDLIALNSEGVKLVFGEGISVGREMTDEIIKKIEVKVSYLNVEQQLGDKMYLGGIEEMPLLNKLKFEMGKNVSNIKIRFTVNNIYLASNFAESLENKKDKTAIVVMGMGHELNPFNKKEMHPFSLSRAMAYETQSNVIVVNEAHYFNIETLQAYIKTHPEELKAVFKAMQG